VSEVTFSVIMMTQGEMETQVPEMEKYIVLTVHG
jgi:hypothetical protein